MKRGHAAAPHVRLKLGSRLLASALALALGVWVPGATAATLSVQVLDKAGQTVPDAVVAVFHAAMPQGGAAPDKAPLTVTVLQERMQFRPALTVVPAGTRVRFVNHDAWDHHIRGTAAGLAQFSSGGGGFELRLDGKADGKPAHAVEVTLTKAGAIQLGCHIHGSMRGHLYVSDSPLTKQTNRDGLAEFDGLPHGPVQVRVWHADQLLDLPAVHVQVIADTPTRAVIQLQVVPRRRRL